VPSLAAAIIASIAGWVVDALIADFLGIGARIFIGIAVSTYVYVYARNWLLRLKNGG
jgi:hypothetical protein